ncbi:MAG: hypothetical protein JXR56_00470, partial [Candidatus Cloacimonetes bacterium]|nr:hypothetical protein [Candidatus Cloacimonadota bacterium]
NLNGRMTFAQMGSMDLVGKLDFGFGSETIDDGVGDDDTASMMGVNLGIAGVIKPNDMNTIVLGVTPFGFDNNGTDDGTNTYSNTNIIVPSFNIGLESQVNNWLVVRAGIEQIYCMNSQVWDDGTNEVTVSAWNSNFGYNMGMGVMYKNFTLDFVFEEDFLHDGPNFITGQNTGNIAGEMMLKYKF